MKQTDFLKWLAERGVTFKEGTKHIKAYYNDKQSTIPRHPSKELPTGLVHAIKKQLGIK